MAFYLLLEPKSNMLLFREMSKHELDYISNITVEDLNLTPQVRQIDAYAVDK